MDANDAARTVAQLNDEEQATLFRELAAVMTEHTMVEAIRAMPENDQQSFADAAFEACSPARSRGSLATGGATGEDDGR